MLLTQGGQIVTRLDLERPGKVFVYAYQIAPDFAVTVIKQGPAPPVWTADERYHSWRCLMLDGSFVAYLEEGEQHYDWALACIASIENFTRHFLGPWQGFTQSTRAE